MSYYSPFGGTGPYGTYGNLGLYGALVAYGTLNLTESSPPQSFTEVLTLEDVKSYLKVPERSPVDPDEDAELQSLIVAAREQAEIAQARDLVQKQYDASFDYWPGYRVELGAPLVSVDLVQYRDSTGAYTALTENVDYVVDKAKRPGVLAPPYNGTWPTFTPWPTSAILVRFTSGFASNSAWWSDSGASVKSGMRLLISDWYNNRLPFVRGQEVLFDYPMGLRMLLGAGSIPRAR